jgi:hypothetical protein
MTLSGFITEQRSIQRILEHIREPTGYRPSPRPVVHPMGKSTSIDAKSTRLPRATPPPLWVRRVSW